MLPPTTPGVPGEISFVVDPPGPGNAPSGGGARETLIFNSICLKTNGIEHPFWSPIGPHGLALVGCRASSRGRRRGGRGDGRCVQPPVLRPITFHSTHRRLGSDGHCTTEPGPRRGLEPQYHGHRLSPGTPKPRGRGRLLRRSRWRAFRRLLARPGRPLEFDLLHVRAGRAGVRSRDVGQLDSATGAGFHHRVGRGRRADHQPTRHTGRHAPTPDPERCPLRRQPGGRDLRGPTSRECPQRTALIRIIQRHQRERFRLHRPDRARHVLRRFERLLDVRPGNFRGVPHRDRRRRQHQCQRPDSVSGTLERSGPPRRPSDHHLRARVRTQREHLCPAGPIGPPWERYNPGM